MGSGIKVYISSKEFSYLRKENVYLELIENIASTLM